MEVALALRNFSYYTSSETLYIQGTVQIKNSIEGQTKNCSTYAEIKKGSKINLKYLTADSEKINLLVSERLVKIRSTELSLPTEPTRCVTFIADSIEKCEI